MPPFLIPPSVLLKSPVDWDEEGRSEVQANDLKKRGSEEWCMRWREVEILKEKEGRGRDGDEDGIAKT